jgi:hypothetical protein
MTKKSAIIIGSVGLVAVSTALLFSKSFSTNSKGEYESKQLSSLEQKSAEDAKKWLESKYIDDETGEPISPEKFQAILKADKSKPKSTTIQFEELGPDNIGGRTRAILIDQTNKNRIWAGGVSGGLFVTTNRANSWNRVDAFPGSPYISSMTQTANGTIFVATGFAGEKGENGSWTGNGLWYSSDFGETWNVVPGTSSIAAVNVVVSPDAGNTVWFGNTTSGPDNGVKKWTIGEASFTPVQIASGTCTVLEVSKNGQVFIAGMAGDHRTYVSTDAGTTWEPRFGTVNNNLVPTGGMRMEYAISPTLNSQNMYSMYAVRTNLNLMSMHVSHDNGATWNQFVGSNVSGGVTSPVLDIYRDQGYYNTVVSVAPNDPEKIFIGGIDIWQWKQTVSNPPSGGFEKLSQWFFSPNNPKYVHADNHEMKWDVDNRLYIGNDGGVNISTNFGSTFFPANRGYNVTQFYAIGMDRNGRVIGGTQDNGTLYNDFSLSTTKEFREVMGGDGFGCDISFFNPNVMFGSIYYGDIYRSGNRGQSFGSFAPSAMAQANQPFVTKFRLGEYYDVNSKDSVIFFPRENYKKDSLMQVPSASSGNFISVLAPRDLYYDDTVTHTPSLTTTSYRVIDGITGEMFDLGQNSYTITTDALPTGLSVNDVLLINGVTSVTVSVLTPYTHYFAFHPPTNKTFDMGDDSVHFNISWDTLTIADPYQSWFLAYVNAAGNNQAEIWGTRDALKLSASQIVWVKVADVAQGDADIEFSRDLNHIYVSTSRAYRIDGLGSIYSQDPDFNSKVAAAAAARVQISSIPTSGIAVNPNNSSDVIILQSSSALGRIYRSSNATVASPTFSELQNVGVFGYDAIIDREDPDLIVVATAAGVKVSTNNGLVWTDASTGFDNVPVYHVRQNWRTWEEGNRRPGEIYIGTFGRGIWASTSVLSSGDKTKNNAGIKII